MKPREVKLPSGAKLTVQPAPFAEAKELYQCILGELKGIEIHTNMQMGNVFKDMFCVGFSSPVIEECLWKCFPRCLYNGLKIDKETFENPETWQDYMQVCIEVAKENTSPFLKSLYAEWSNALAKSETTQK